MRWPWQRHHGKGRLALRIVEDKLVYVKAQPLAQGRMHISRWGIERDAALGSDDESALRSLARRLDLHAAEVLALAELNDYQVLKVDTPKVDASELKSAVRWQIKDMIIADLNAMTIDVMHVGQDRQRVPAQVFVVAANNMALGRLTRFAAAADIELHAVDIWETALRNLQFELARKANELDRATATLMQYGNETLLTISAHGELFYTRRLDWDEHLLQDTGPVTQANSAMLDAPLGYEYMPGMDDEGTGGLNLPQDDGSALVLDLQRSIDVWDRSWPELPLHGVQVLAQQQAPALAARLQTQLGVRCLPMDLDPLFSGLPTPAQAPDFHAECLPLLGLLLRHEARQL